MGQRLGSPTYPIKLQQQGFDVMAPITEVPPNTSPLLGSRHTERRIVADRMSGQLQHVEHRIEDITALLRLFKVELARIVSGLVSEYPIIPNEDPAWWLAVRQDRSARNRSVTTNG